MITFDKKVHKKFVILNHHSTSSDYYFNDFFIKIFIKSYHQLFIHLFNSFFHFLLIFEKRE